jgi:(2R)-sulfolactate sulfo-lyase subunit beta
VHQTSAQVREECQLKELWVAAKCGESDTTTGLASCPTVGNMYDKLIPFGLYGCFGETSELTGAEHLAAARAVSPEIAEKFMKTWSAYQRDVIEANKNSDLSESQPTKGNIAGGLTTIEEKALGNLEKIGRNVKFIDVLEPAEAPARGPGLYFMDTSSAAAECCTLQAAAGYVVHIFPTGQGNVIGNPIMPVIKVTGNPRTVRTMSEHIDVDVSGIVRRDLTISQAGDSLIDMMVSTANGRFTAAEALGHREFVMTKLYRSA